MSAPRTIVVTGIPRSGTSLMMQMLAAGGVPIAADGMRAADDDNPRGYFELESVRSLRPDTASFFEAIGGCAVKIVAPLVYRIPPAVCCDVLVMLRDAHEIAASQRAMLARHGRHGSDDLLPLLCREQERLSRWLSTRAAFRTLNVAHRDLLEDGERAVATVAAFLGRPLDRPAMLAAVDPALYRNRIQQPAAILETPRPLPP